MTKKNPFDGRSLWAPHRMRAAALVLALGTLLAASATAHGPPAVRDQDVRLLADHSDDCGGDDASALAQCGGAHDLVGLDLREAHDAALGDLVYFRFILNGGGSGALKDVLTLKAGGSTKTFELRTSDNQAYQGTGFETISKGPALNADGSQDGTRVVVEASVKLTALGGAGATLDDYVVESYRGSTRGDVMPGCYYNALGSKVASCSPGDDQPQFERVNGYVLRGPTYYVTAGLPTDVDASPGSTTDADVKLTNPLRATAQTVTLVLSAPAGVTATWAGSNAATTTVDLGKAGSATATLHLQADAGAAPGKLTLTVTTNLGGRSVHEVPFDVGTAASSTGTTTVVDPETSPAPAAILTAVGLLALAAARRRA